MSLFKWIANFGFYIHYFQVGVGFITTGVGTVVVYLENRAKESEQEAEERRYREEAERRAQREQEHERRYHEEQEGRNHEEQERRNQQEAEKNQKRRGKRRGQH
ncbi:hypothetical protein DXG01_011508 [Tephrocybe rancida]|nr:hypothetical protein DXG01_011508 [Tephrocybe rancida]